MHVRAPRPAPRIPGCVPEASKSIVRRLPTRSTSTAKRILPPPAPTCKRITRAFIVRTIGLPVQMSEASKRGTNAPRSLATPTIQSGVPESFRASTTGNTSSIAPTGIAHRCSPSQTSTMRIHKLPYDVSEILNVATPSRNDVIDSCNPAAALHVSCAAVTASRAPLVSCPIASEICFAPSV